MNFTPDSKFMIFCGKLVALTQINLLWLICSLPLISAGAATTAMISCLYAFRADMPCGAKVFFSAFRKNFSRATLLWLAMLFLGSMLALDYVIAASTQFPGALFAIGLICFVGFALILFGGMIFPLISQFPGSIQETVINTILLCIANLPKMLLVTSMNLLPFLLLLLLPQVFILLGFLWILCGFSMMALYDIHVIEKIFAPFRKCREATV